MNELFDKYGISAELSKDEQLEALEKQKQKLLRKLNHVFGNPEKEEELNREMDSLEAAMEALRQSGGTLSLSDITVETRALSQTAANPENARRIRIQGLEQRIFEENPEIFEIITDLYEIAVFYLQQRDFEKYEFWLYYGASKGLTEFMSYLFSFYSNEVYGHLDRQKAFYWMKKGAENGEKDCCEAMGDYCLSGEPSDGDLKKAVAFYVKAADEEHTEAYIKAFRAFYILRDLKKAEICLAEAEKLGVKGTEECRKMLAKA